MSVPAVSGVSAVFPTAPTTGAESVGMRGLGITEPSANGFGSVLSGAIEGLTAAQNRSSSLAVQAVTGSLEDVHAYTIAATEAQVALELTVAVRNKAVDAFNEIMRMQA